MLSIRTRHVHVSNEWESAFKSDHQRSSIGVFDIDDLQGFNFAILNFCNHSESVHGAPFIGPPADRS